MATLITPLIEGWNHRRRTYQVQHLSRTTRHLHRNHRRPRRQTRPHLLRTLSRPIHHTRHQTHLHPNRYRLPRSSHHHTHQSLSLESYQSPFQQY